VTKSAFSILLGDLYPSSFRTRKSIASSIKYFGPFSGNYRFSYGFKGLLPPDVASVPQISTKKLCSLSFCYTFLFFLNDVYQTHRHFFEMLRIVSIFFSFYMVYFFDFSSLAIMRVWRVWIARGVPQLSPPGIRLNCPGFYSSTFAF